MRAAGSVRRFALLLACLFAAGCATLPDTDEMINRHSEQAVRFETAHGLLSTQTSARIINKLLLDGPATYAAMFAAIGGANDHTNLESYIIDDDVRPAVRRSPAGQPAPGRQRIRSAGAIPTCRSRDR